jgi:hypothetical protein
MWELGRDLITVAQHERIEEVEADRRDADDDLPLSGGWIRDLFDAQLLRSAELAELCHAHGCFLAFVLALLAGSGDKAVAYGINDP